MRTRVEVVNNHEFVNYNKALRLVAKGYAAFVDAEQKQLRYLDGYEHMRLRSEMWRDDSAGEWRPAHSGKRPMCGGPQARTLQFRAGRRTR